MHIITCPTCIIVTFIRQSLKAIRFCKVKGKPNLCT